MENGTADLTDVYLLLDQEDKVEAEELSVVNEGTVEENSSKDPKTETRVSEDTLDTPMIDDDAALAVPSLPKLKRMKKTTSEKQVLKPMNKLASTKKKLMRANSVISITTKRKIEVLYSTKDPAMI